jgi:hypothetical protein
MEGSFEDIMMTASSGESIDLGFSLWLLDDFP